MNANYIVMAVTLIIWVGIFVYRVMIDRRTKKLEEQK